MASSRCSEFTKVPRKLRVWDRKSQAFREHHDRVRRRIIARGAHVSFNVREREAVDKLQEAFRKAVLMCRNKVQVDH